MNGDKSGLNGHGPQPQPKSTRIPQQEEDKARLKIESDKKKGRKLDGNGLTGKEPHEAQLASVPKHMNGIQANGTAGNVKVSNCTTSNGVVSNGVGLSHGTLV